MSRLLHMLRHEAAVGKWRDALTQNKRENAPTSICATPRIDEGEGDLVDKIEALLIAEDEREKLTVDLKIGLINHLFEFFGLTLDDIRSAVKPQKPAKKKSAGAKRKPKRNADGLPTFVPLKI